MVVGSNPIIYPPAHLTESVDVTDLKSVLHRRYWFNSNSEHLEYSQMVKAFVFDTNIYGFNSFYSSIVLEKMAERLKAIDCKSVGKFLRRFESYFFQGCVYCRAKNKNFYSIFCN